MDFSVSIYAFANGSGKNITEFHMPRKYQELPIELFLWTNPEFGHRGHNSAFIFRIRDKWTQMGSPGNVTIAFSKDDIH
jgi:hypothetical protein